MIIGGWILNNLDLIGIMSDCNKIYSFRAKFWHLFRASSASPSHFSLKMLIFRLFSTSHAESVIAEVNANISFPIQKHRKFTNRERRKKIEKRLMKDFRNFPPRAAICERKRFLLNFLIMWLMWIFVCLAKNLLNGAC